jgi:hypothetical protein
VKANEGVEFSVTDLVRQATDLGGIGGDRAWKISYDTKREADITDRPMPAAGGGGE